MRHAESSATSMAAKRAAAMDRPSHGPGLSSAPDHVFQNIFLQAASGIALVSTDGCFIDLNPALCELLGRSREELIGANVMDITHPDDIAISKEAIRSVAEGGVHKLQFEKRYLRPDGEIVWVGITADALLNEDGKCGSFVSTFLNITALKSAQQTLKEELTTYQTVLQTTQQGYWMVDLEGRILDVNDAYCSFSGYSRDELLRMHVSQVDSIQSAEDVAANVQKIVDIGFGQFDTKHRRKDGSIIELQVTATFNKAIGNRIFSFFQDLTQRELDARAVKSARDQLTTLIDALPDAVIFTDGLGRWRVVNQKAITLLGLKDLAWAYHTSKELAKINPALKELHNACSRHEDAVWRSRQTQVHHCVITDRNENGRLLEVRQTPMLDEQGQRKSMLMVARDVTDLERAVAMRKQAEALAEEIRQRAIEAESAMVNISEYTLRQIGQELHDDLGQILTGAAMMADVMAKDLESSAPDQAKSMQNLTKLLSNAVSKTRLISHGLYPIELEQGALLPMLQSLVEHLKSISPIKVRLFQQSDPPELSREQAIHLFRIVQEAASNVLRHSRASEMSVTIGIYKNVFRITIVDNGEGLKRAGRPRKHAGIGLQTMRSRAELIGGSFSAVSPKQGGARIAVSLPIKARA